MPKQINNATPSLQSLHAHARRETRKLEIWVPDLDLAAEEIGISRAYALQLLAELERRGAIAKLNGRRGMYVVETEIPDSERQAAP